MYVYIYLCTETFIYMYIYMPVQSACALLRGKMAEAKFGGVSCEGLRGTATQRVQLAGLLLRNLIQVAITRIRKKQQGSIAGLL